MTSRNLWLQRHKICEIRRFEKKKILRRQKSQKGFPGTIRETELIYIQLKRMICAWLEYVPART